MIFRHLLNMRSHPTWVRGLKQQYKTAPMLAIQSHPTWVRGLKQTPLSSSKESRSRTLRGCVD